MMTSSRLIRIISDTISLPSNHISLHTAERFWQSLAESSRSSTIANHHLQQGQKIHICLRSIAIDIQATPFGVVEQ